MMLYKNFFRGVLLIIFIVAGIIYPSLFLLQLNVKRDSVKYIDDWWKCKEKYAASIKTKKILVVSGSNTLFSVNARSIEKELNIPTVNFGVHAGLGLRYILERVSPIIKEDDIVLLPLEYEMYKDVQPFGGEYGTYISAYDSEYFKQNDLLYKVKFIYSMRFNEIKHGIQVRFKSGNNKTGYDDLGMNKNGDITGNTYEKRKPNKVNIKMLEAFQGSGYPTKESQKCLDEFIDSCIRKNCTILVTYPAYYQPKHAFSGKGLKVVEDVTVYWQRKEGTHLISSAGDNLYDLADFYDGNYHMNDIGRTKRTLQLIKEIRPYL